MTNENFSDLSMLDLFHMEVETQATLFNENLLIVEGRMNEPIESLQPFLETLMRAAHSIKGAARIVGLEEVVAVAHRMEDCFVAMQKGEVQLGDRQIDVLFGVVDWFTTIQQIPADNLPDWTASQTETVARLVSQLTTIANNEEVTSPTPSKITNDSLEEVNPGVINREVEAEAIANPSIKETLPENAIPSQIIGSTLPSNAVPAVSQKSISTHAAQEEDSDKTNDNRSIRVSTENLNQIMALAGESVVESHWLQRFGDSTIHLRRQQQEVIRYLDQLQQQLPSEAEAQKTIDKARKITLDSYTLLNDRLTELDQFSRRFDQLSDNLYREVIASHMRPFVDGISAFPRIARDLAKELDKKVKLEMQGLSIKVDRDILKKL